MSAEEELDVAPDLASQQWWDDNWVQVAAGGSLSTPTLAWRYFAASIFIDHETDNWNWHVQFSEDPTFDWTRMEQTLTTMYGKQYRFNTTRSQPPNYWVIEKIHKYQQTIRNDLGQRVTVTRERLLEVFVIVDRKVMKCSTLYDLANVRVLGAMHSLSTALDRLRAHIPAPNVRETSFWQSETVKVPEEQSLQLQVEKETESMPGIAAGEDLHGGFPPTTNETDEATKDHQVPALSAAGHAVAGKTTRKRPDPYQLTILHAMQTTQNSLKAPIDDPPPPPTHGTSNTSAEPTVDAYGAWGIKTLEEEQAEKLMRVMSDANAANAANGRVGGVGGQGGRVEMTTTRTSSGAGGGVKRAVDEAVRGMAKQARFKV
ncbi:hypothetical protein QFC21_001103 [Naganishia friedmannii]|uniref:Uncharacterized protein n=1 Tax=Naganishia friedmannii TaxID=89922 RepID=A0ACC2W893_9TREE|nr:hypothetical protein QFC21_001103 [Naganishia friedmannii]